ncbi:MAG: hypothetical protein QNK33_06370, partial [Bacteroidales bacterium]|nr:hypothetical protein [Bacteroidales bacterium]
VTAYGVEREGSEDISDNYIKALPGSGMTKFRDYIRDNQIFPEDWTDSDREVVRLKFTVKLDNTLSNFEIVRSPDTLFSTEAIRLIKEGPAWTPASMNNTSNEGIASLRIVFRRK